jgi:excisionase family DNA binding protein
MGYMTLGEAAHYAGVSKSTISKALTKGRLSYVSKDTSGYQIDPAELFRVFPPKPTETVSSERLETPTETGDLRVLRAELDAARELVAELKADRDAWREQAQRLALPAPDNERRRRFLGIF